MPQGSSAVRPTNGLYLFSHQMEDEIGGASSTHGVETKYMKDFGEETWRKMTTWNV